MIFFNAINWGSVSKGNSPRATQIVNVRVGIRYPGLWVFRRQCFFFRIFASPWASSISITWDIVRHIESPASFLNPTDRESAFLTVLSDESCVHENVRGPGLQSINGKAKSECKQLCNLPQGHPSSIRFLVKVITSLTQPVAPTITLGFAHSESKKKFPEQVTLTFTPFAQVFTAHIVLTTQNRSC